MQVCTPYTASCLLPTLAAACRDGPSVKSVVGLWRDVQKVSLCGAAEVSENERACRKTTESARDRTWQAKCLTEKRLEPWGVKE